MAASKPKTKRKPNRVDGLRALDRYGSRPTGRGGAARPQPNPFQQTGPSTGAPSGPQQFMHPFIPGASLHPLVPASLSESGSAPGTPNLAAMVMRSFQPAILAGTAPVSTGASGLPPQQQPQPNPQYNFGGGSQLPPGHQGMQR